MRIETEKITVLGAGVMGHGIAQEFIDKTRNGIERNLRRQVDRGRMVEKEAKRVLGTISFILDMEEAVREADIVIETIPERMELKKQVWAEVSSYAKEEAILATARAWWKRVIPPPTTSISLESLIFPLVSSFEGPKIRFMTK
jgi:3-hydroxyacyl-CoA dehydrogenase